MTHALPELQALGAEAQPTGRRGTGALQARSDMDISSAPVHVPKASGSAGGRGGAAPEGARLRVKSCPSCKTRFRPERAGQAACGVDCALALVAAARAKQERATDRARAEALKSIRELTSEAQAAFNDYIRARDAGQRCICCNKPFEPQKPGGAIDAGHFVSRANALYLRFDEANVHAQRKNCNRPGGATYGEFRAGVIARVGLAEVVRLEGPAPADPPKYTREDLIALKKTYQAKARALRDAAKVPQGALELA